MPDGQDRRPAFSLIWRKKARLVQKLPQLSDIENALRGVFETCRIATDDKFISPIVAKASIAIAGEYRGTGRTHIRDIRLDRGDCRLT